jgi:hypothetical protein
LWKLKVSKADGRPFSVGSDLYSATLDMICGIAFGMESGSSALQHETAHVQNINPKFPDIKGEPVYFPPAPIIPELEALFDIPEMVAIAQASPFPSFSQAIALLNPKHARAHWDRKTLLRRQVDISLRRRSLQPLTSPSSECNSPCSDECKSALDQLLWQEMKAAKKTGRAPDYHSPAIRDEVRPPQIIHF